MRKLIGIFSVVAVVLVAAVAYAQTRCGSNLCIGSANTTLQVQGNDDDRGRHHEDHVHHERRIPGRVHGDGHRGQHLLLHHRRSDRGEGRWADVRSACREPRSPRPRSTPPPTVANILCL
jgi:hypothetical protein